MFSDVFFVDFWFEKAFNQLGSNEDLLEEVVQLSLQMLSVFELSCVHLRFLLKLGNVINNSSKFLLESINNYFNLVKDHSAVIQLLVKKSHFLVDRQIVSD